MDKFRQRASEDGMAAAGRTRRGRPGVLLQGKIKGAESLQRSGQRSQVAKPARIQVAERGKRRKWTLSQVTLAVDEQAPCCFYRTPRPIFLYATRTALDIVARVVPQRAQRGWPPPVSTSRPVLDIHIHRGDKSGTSMYTEADSDPAFNRDSVIVWTCFRKDCLGKEWAVAERRVQAFGAFTKHSPPGTASSED
ncbi:hypothetical protein BBAD15_g6257 [Beauveria bassiana D1-5]|uniref:Uncharacterized protein n=1 Tax=Beauveria bassiana D1-5 TaxID=1245745 RepID=A0A0A2VKK1_BEABA|nr:hypothetical protein BBAD15_g6257 [Beauveria bassiana D1-5]